MIRVHVPLHSLPFTCTFGTLCATQDALPVQCAVAKEEEWRLARTRDDPRPQALPQTVCYRQCVTVESMRWQQLERKWKKRCSIMFPSARTPGLTTELRRCSTDSPPAYLHSATVLYTLLRSPSCSGSGWWRWWCRCPPTCSRPRCHRRDRTAGAHAACQHCSRPRAARPHAAGCTQASITCTQASITWHASASATGSGDCSLYRDGGGAGEVSPLAVLVGTRLAGGGLLGEAAEHVARGVGLGVHGVATGADPVGARKGHEVVKIGEHFFCSSRKPTTAGVSTAERAGGVPRHWRGMPHAACPSGRAASWRPPAVCGPAHSRFQSSLVPHRAQPAAAHPPPSSSCCYEGVLCCCSRRGGQAKAGQRAGRGGARAAAAAAAAAARSAGRCASAEAAAAAQARSPRRSTSLRSAPVV